MLLEYYVLLWLSHFLKDPMNDSVIDWNLGEALPIADVIKRHKKKAKLTFANAIPSPNMEID